MSGTGKEPGISHASSVEYVEGILFLSSAATCGTMSTRSSGRESAAIEKKYRSIIVLFWCEIYLDGLLNKSPSYHVNAAASRAHAVIKMNAVKYIDAMIGHGLWPCPMYW